MEEESILDPLNELHLMGLHFVYVPLVNKKLNLWQSAWAHHRMRTTRSTPAQMWLTGQINHPMKLDLTSIPLQDFRKIVKINLVGMRSNCREIVLYFFHWTAQGCIC